MSTAAAIGAPWTGFLCGLIAWFVTTWKRSGSIDVATTGDTTNAVAGNVTACGVGLLMSFVLTFTFPAKYVSDDAKHIERSNKIQGISARVPDNKSEAEAREKSPANESDDHKQDSVNRKDPTAAPEPESFVPTGNEMVDYLESKQMEPMDAVAVKRSERFARVANLAFGTFAIIVVPFSLFGTGYIFNRAFFTGWLVVSFIWVWLSMCICVIYPVVESSGSLWQVSVGLWSDMKVLVGGKKARAQTTDVES